MKFCSVDDCDRKQDARGYCKKHYSRFRRWGDPLIVKYHKGNGSCLVEGCTNKYHSKGYCNKHSARLTRYGDPLGKPESRRSNGNGYIDRNGYIILYAPENPNSSKTGKLMEHRMVMSNFIGRTLYKDETVHHKNGIRNDNRIENLELMVKYHPIGQKPEHLVLWAEEILDRYGGERKDRREREFRSFGEGLH
jgi:hypothetical protein